MTPVLSDVVLFTICFPASRAASMSPVMSDLHISPATSPTGSPFLLDFPSRLGPLLSSSPTICSSVFPLDLIYVLICLNSLFNNPRPICLLIDFRLFAHIPWYFAYVHPKLPTWVSHLPTEMLLYPSKN